MSISTPLQDGRIIDFRQTAEMDVTRGSAALHPWLLACRPPIKLRAGTFRTGEVGLEAPTYAKKISKKIAAPLDFVILAPYIASALMGFY